MLNYLTKKIKQQPLLLVLSILVGIIAVSSLKPNYYLAGWDNYSSYLNIPTNFFRTFFSTWRAHRGLGVPSDSEVTDVFRQILFVIIQPFVGKIMTDQLYYIYSLIAGTFGMYALAIYILKHAEGDKKKFTPPQYDIFGFISAFFYLFNLNTLSVFYFPIQPFVTRYFSLPLVFFLIAVLQHQKNLSKKAYIALIFGLFMTTPSYIIGTVFITTIIGLILFMAFQLQWKKALTIIIFFVAINAFWLLTFLNYSFEKSKIIRLAPTYIEANEAQLNKSPSYYALINQLIQLPGFFETQITELNTNKQKYAHTLANKLNRPFEMSAFLLPAFLSLIGLLAMVSQRHRWSTLFWIPSTYLLFIFLSMKQYSPLGFLYQFLVTKIPLFDVIFRFGDTKFHPMIAFSGSLLASFGLLWIIQHFRRGITYGAITLLLITNLFVFSSYFNGKLIGFFMYTKIPDSYFTIASQINKDTRPGRVLHLPYDRNMYWRSYNWGYLGSEFFGFMINKPLMEKTFEPASSENAVANKKIFELINNTQFITNESGLQKHALDFYRLLAQYGIRYLIADASVSKVSIARQMIFWGEYPQVDTNIICSALERNGYAHIVKREGDLTLYEIVNPVGQLTSVQSKTAGLSMPFASISTPIILKSGKITIDPSTKVQKQTLSKKNKESTHLLHVYVKRDKNNLFFTITEQLLPNSKPVYRGGFIVPLGKLVNFNTISNNADSILNNWHVLQNKNIGTARIVVGQTILPIPDTITTSDTYIGGVIVDNTTVPVTVYNLINSIDISTKLAATVNSNCLGDALDSYSSSFTYSSQGIIIHSTNGSSCADAKFDFSDQKEPILAELSLSAWGDTSDTQDKLPKKPLFLKICTHETINQTCMQAHQILALTNNERNYIVPLDRILFSDNPLTTTFTVFNQGEQKSEVHIENLSWNIYGLVGEHDIGLPLIDSTVNVVTTPTAGLTFEKYLSTNSFYLQNGLDGWYIPNKTICDKPGATRQTQYSNGVITSIVDNCETKLLQEIPYSSKSFLLWLLHYKLLSGQIPRTYIIDKFKTISSDRIGIEQGYPNTKDGTKYVGYQYVYPNLFDDSKTKQFGIEHYSENKGIFEIIGFDLIELPSSWVNLTIGTKNVENYMEAHLNYSRPIPSLLLIDIKPKEKTNLNILIRFNEAYDKQWISFPHFISHSKCYEFANCFIFDKSTSKVLIFYLPEVFSMIGWATTITTIITGYFLMFGKKKNI